MAKKKKIKKQSSGLLARLGSPSKKTISRDDGEPSALYEVASSINTNSIIKGIGVIFILLAILQIFTLFGSGGYLGKLIQEMFISGFGILGYASPLVFASLGYYIYLRRLPSVSLKRSLGYIGLVLGGLAIPNLLSRLTDTSIGGTTGNILAVSFDNLFSYYPGLLFLTLLCAFSIGLIFEYIPTMSDIKSLRDKVRLPVFTLPSIGLFKKGSDAEYADDIDDTSDSETIDIRSELLKKTKRIKRETLAQDEDSYQETEYKEANTPIRQKKIDFRDSAHEKKIQPRAVSTDFIAPPLSLLEKDSGKASVGDTKANMTIIKRTLSEFGISVEMDEVSIGPSVTRYTLKPAQGVKLSRIANHRQELAYALRAESIRIEAPIPGKALVGIEIPNEKKSMVGLGSLLAENGWSNPAPLLVALGKGISGNALYSNLAKMPHLLIAGTTGSGKSVMVHSIINSLLFRNSPEALKFIMVDPKKVELTMYNNIPHLYTPVITNAKLAIRTLNWAINEMEHRYDTLEEKGVRDISSYHKDVYQRALSASKNSDDSLPTRMPYIVIIIDELADIMMSYPKELEAAIVRLAQKSRAVGIHLILSTQRPSVNVITGLIKANIPSRIALKVASQIDSRTIIDTAGAEQLLGQGDLLFTSSENPKQERVQSAFVSDAEVKRVVDYLKKTYRDMLPDEINIDADSKGGAGSALFATSLGSVDGGDTDDDLFEEARDIVISANKASTSYLQRRLKIGYSRAARLMDMLEERGIIGPGDGAKAREVLGGSDSNDFDDSSSEDE